MAASEHWLHALLFLITVLGLAFETFFLARGFDLSNFTKAFQGFSATVQNACLLSRHDLWYTPVPILVEKQKHTGISYV
jgi:hypothetical protein